jgi:preprotein translocase SecE subunit
MSSVAVKKPETSRGGPLDRLHVALLAGVVYVIGSLAILFGLLPWLWWAPGPLGFARPATNYPAVGATVGLILVGLAVAAGLVYLGGRLLGPSPAPGVKAGIFTGLVTLLVLALVTRWVSLIFEGMVYDSRTFSEQIGIALTAAVGVVLLVAVVRFVFLAPSFGAKMVAFEEQGWFSATSYKRSQGRLVRRGTIVGILALGICGIYTLLSHQTLAGSGDWGLAIPWTGKADVRSLNDARVLYADKRRVREIEVPVPEGKSVGDSPLGISKESRPELDAEGNPVGVIAVNVIPDSAAWKAEIHDGDTVAAVNDTVVTDVDKLRELLEAAREAKAVTVRLRVLDGAGFLVDQATFRDKNNDLTTNYFKITDRGTSSLEPGVVMKKGDYEKVRQEIAEGKDPRAKEPAFKKPDPATASVAYATIPVLPHVKYTLPILIAALGLWLAWRVVNVPSFADFLIATEAELNKVSWTTRRRLVQDTIVVLVTVFLFTLFLFVVDVAWGQILSLKAIGVLKLPEKGQGDKPAEQNW